MLTIIYLLIQIQIKDCKKTLSRRIYDDDDYTTKKKKEEYA
jgi:hypothetical protein